MQFTWGMMGTVFAPFVAVLTDKLGTRISASIFLTLVGTLTLLHTLPPNVYSLAVLRALFMLFSFGFQSTSLAAAVQYCEPTMIGRVVPLIEIAWSFSSLAIVPVLSAIHGTSLGWRGVYAIGGGALLCVAPILYYVLPSTQEIAEIHQKVDHIVVAFK